MSQPAFLALDNLDDRREVHRLLQVLHPRLAVRWLDRQCRRVKGPHGSRPAPARKMAGRVADAEKFGGERHYRLATELYLDFWVLCSQFGLDADAATRELEEMARKQP